MSDEPQKLSAEYLGHLVERVVARSGLVLGEDVTMHVKPNGDGTCTLYMAPRVFLSATFAEGHEEHKLIDTIMSMVLACNEYHAGFGLYIERSPKLLRQLHEAKTRMQRRMKREKLQLVKDPDATPVEGVKLL